MTRPRRRQRADGRADLELGPGPGRPPEEAVRLADTHGDVPLGFDARRRADRRGRVLRGAGEGAGRRSPGAWPSATATRGDSPSRAPLELQVGHRRPAAFPQISRDQIEKALADFAAGSAGRVSGCVRSTSSVTGSALDMGDVAGADVGPRPLGEVAERRPERLPGVHASTTRSGTWPPSAATTRPSRAGPILEGRMGCWKSPT